jgi:hypothetical protein
VLDHLHERLACGCHTVMEVILVFGNINSIAHTTDIDKEIHSTSVHKGRV